MSVRIAGCMMLLAGCGKPSPLNGAFLKLPSPKAAVHSELVLHCVPEDAEVALDGVPQGTCEDYRGEPHGLSLARGAHHIAVTKRGYFPWDMVLETDGTRVVMQPVLLPTEAAPP
jgi:hypothetical protein